MLNSAWAVARGAARGVAATRDGSCGREPTRRRAGDGSAGAAADGRAAGALQSRGAARLNSGRAPVGCG